MFVGHIEYSINIMLCHTNRESDIPNPELCINSCRGLLMQNIKAFMPKVAVPMGLKACHALGLTGNMGQLHGKLITNFKIPIIPLFHPSYVKQYNKHAQFNQGWNQLLKFLGEKPQKEVKIIPAGKGTQQSIKKTPQFNISDDKMITEVTPDLTFFDVREVSGGTIVKIFIDQHGTKKYLIEDNIMRFFVNQGDWNDHTMINTGFDSVVEVNGWEKRDVMGTIREHFNGKIGNLE